MKQCRSLRISFALAMIVGVATPGTGLCASADQATAGNRSIAGSADGASPITIPTLAYAYIHEAHREELRSRVKSAFSIIDDYYELVLKGKLDDERAQHFALRRLRERRFGSADSDVVYVLDNSLKLLMHPGNERSEGKYVGNVTDPKGRFVFRELVQPAKSIDGAFLHYHEQPRRRWDKEKTVLTHARYYSRWGWLVCASLNL